MKAQITKIVLEAVNNTLNDMKKIQIAENDTRILDVKEKAKAALKNVKKYGYNVKLRINRNPDGYVGVYATLRNWDDNDDIFDNSSRISKFCKSMKENGFELETGILEGEWSWIFNDELWRETDRKHNERTDNRDRGFDDGAEHYQWNDLDRRNNFWDKRYYNDMKKIQIAENDITRMVYEAAKRILKEWRYNRGSQGKIIIDLADIFENISKQPSSMMTPNELAKYADDFNKGNYVTPQEYTDEIFEYFNSHKKVNDFDDVYYYIDATFIYDAPDPEVGWGGNGWELDRDKGVDDLIRMIKEYPEFTNVVKTKLIQGVQQAYNKAIEEGDWTIEEEDNPYDLDMRDYYEDR